VFYSLKDHSTPSKHNARHPQPRTIIKRNIQKHFSQSTRYINQTSCPDHLLTSPQAANMYTKTAVMAIGLFFGLTVAAPTLVEARDTFRLLPLCQQRRLGQCLRGCELWPLRKQQRCWWNLCRPRQQFTDFSDACVRQGSSFCSFS
jgi:hypothetical protein